MKNSLYKLLFFLILTTQIHAQSARDFSQKENPNWRTFKSEKQVSATVLSHDKAALRLDTNDELELLDTQDDALGFRHYRYQQTYKGIPIEGAIYLMHEKNNLVKNANGKLIQQLDLKNTPAISEATALHAALRHVDASLYAWNDPVHEASLKQTQDCSDASFYPYGELVIIAPGEQKKADDYRLAYKFDIYAVQPLTRQIVYVDAQNETVLTSIEKIHNCTGTPASGATKYSDDVDISTCVIGGAYTLRNNDTDADIQVFDAGNTLSSPQVAVTDTDSFFEGDSAAVEVYWATQNTYDYFFNVHGRNSLDDNGIALHSWVHYGNNRNNASWNGAWMTYGDGDNQQFTSFTSPDVVGHEIMHGITDYSADLIYQDEPGALNESFSDIFGEVIEAYSRGTNDWIVGADFTIQAGKNGLRNLSNPKDPNMRTAQPDTYFGDNWHGGSGRSVVHTNSGVQNYWFYLLAEGGSGTNDFGYAYDIEGIGMSKAAAIAYRNLTVYLTPESQYFDARTGAIQAAIDLYPNSDEALQTEAAWAAVGVGTQVTNTCRERDSLALVALHDATNGPNWTQTWDLTEPIDNWYGVFLNQGGCVDSLRLESNQLAGSLPADLGDIERLRHLRLTGNNLSGNIPSELGNLIQLEVLRLGYNQLSGDIPNELGNLYNLGHLRLTNNELTGTIPNSLTNLTNLYYLNLGYNQLTGEIPPELGSMTNLVLLFLRETQLTGEIPTEFGNLINLEALYLERNQLTGEIPDELSHLVNLKHLILDNNQLEGNFPAWLSSLPHLSGLTLDNNQLSGCYSSELSYSCSQLVEYNDNAYISEGNNFDATWEDFCNTGAGMCDAYSACRQSDSLVLVEFYNVNPNANLQWNLNESMDTWYGVTLSNEGCVEEIDFVDEEVAHIPPEFGDLSHLKHLGLNENNLFGSFPLELINLTELEHLDLGENNFSGEIPPELGNLTNLEYLDLSSNNFSGNIPPELENLINLKKLSLSGNGLIGGIPGELGDLINLTSLYLSHNYLTGCYEPNLANLCGQLEQYYISGGVVQMEATWDEFCDTGAGMCNPYGACRESDSLGLVGFFNINYGPNWLHVWNLNQPMETWHGVTLTEYGCVSELNLSGENLSGNLPELLAGFSNLIKLDLSNNQLTGQISDEFAHAFALKWLDLSGNALSGNITPFFNQYYSLFKPEKLFLADNQLTGNIPSEFSKLTSLQELSLQNNQLSGCYDSQLSSLCNQLITSNISEGNNFDATWDDFCNTSAGVCNPYSPCRQSDSLALVALFNTRGSCTIDYAQPLDTWQGITLNEEGCVSEIYFYDSCLGFIELVPELGNLSELEVLVLDDDMDIITPIPPEIGNLTNLRVLRLSEHVPGDIPPELGNLINLERLDLEGTNFSNIPPEIGNLVNLRELEIWGANGIIPAEIGNLTDLMFLKIYGNASGGIPPEIGNLTNLIQLNLNGNQLTGSIPAEISNLTQLQYFHIQGNNLSGCYPSELQSLCNQLSSFSSSITQGNNFDATWEDFCNTGAGMCISQQTCRERDSLNLIAVYSSLNFTPDLTLPIDTWYGVTLNDNGCVSEIDLDDSAGGGFIAPEIGNFSELVDLNLNENGIGGEIPPEIGNLTNLVELDLDENNLTGSIPPEIGNLTQLNRLNLRRNQLSGCHAPELINLCNQLSYVTIDFENDFDATWQDFCNTGAGMCDTQQSCRQSDSLALVAFYNQINGLTWNLNTPMDTWSGLEFNGDGCVTDILLSDSGLSGIIAAELGDLSILGDLRLSNNQLTGEIPVELANLDRLVVLNLSNNELSGSIPAELADLSLLSFLTLSNNQLSGNIPGELGNLSNLQSLYLDNNLLSGEIPIELGNLSRLKILNLSINQLTGPIPIELSLLNNLEYLYLHSNLLNGNIPPGIGDLMNLRLLYMSGNQLTGNIPANLGNLNNLTGLHLTTNQLNGNIPPEIGNLGNLKHLDINGNQLSGDIPVELGNLANIERFLLQDNQLTGSIPFQFAYLNNLTDLRLFTNQLSGCYPSELGILCNQLNYAYISEYNNFDATWQAFCNTGAGSCDPLSSAVWPGDFNNDGIVDNVDVLTWGLAEGNTGVERPNATSDWTAQSCPDWQTSVGIVNGKHQDGDGNGTVDVQDLQALITNYGSTHTAASTNSPLQFRLEEVSSTQSHGQISITYHLLAESSLGTAISTHGLSCSIDFGDLMINSATVDLSNSSLAPDEYVEIYDAQHNTLNLALTRTDHNNQIIDGPIGTMIIVYEDLQSGEPFALRILNGRMMSANGELNPADGTSLYGMVGVSGAANEPLLSVFASDESCYTPGTATAQIIGGTPPYTYAWSNGANTAQVNNLTAGTYTVEITDANDYTQMLDIEIDAPEPAYYESGNPVDCSQYVQWASPQIHVWLEGAYRIETGDMRIDMFEKLTELPPVQPYGEAPWNYRGTEGENWSSDNYPADAVDWVLVSFRDSENIQTVHKKTAALLLQDGYLYFPDARVLPNTTDPVYIMIQHRNHVTAMTPQPVAITNNTLVHDFRLANSHHTDTSIGQKQMPDGTWAMFAGDADPSDTGGYDINGQDKSIWATFNGNFAQYLPTDLNLDGDVTGADKILWEINNGNSSALPK